MRPRYRFLRSWIIGLTVCSLLLVVFVPQLLHFLPHETNYKHHPFDDSLKILGSHTFKQDSNGKLSLIEANFLDFQPNFRIPRSKVPSIPHIIHQVWDTQNIPAWYHKWLPQWLEVNPGWEYWLWTLDDARAFLKLNFPDHLTLFDSYPEVIHRADAIRYFIMYFYGGVYMDLDMEPLKPLNNWTFNYECLLSQENYEHSYIVRAKRSANIVNGIMACKAKHPLFLKAIESLGVYANRHFGDYIRATGPIFLTEVYKKYQNDSNDHSVTVVPPKYFLPTFDRSESEVISTKCFPTRMKDLPIEGQTLCKTLLSRRYKNEPGPEAFTDHHWVHANMFDEQWKKSNTKSIFDLIPEAKLKFTLKRD